MPPRTVGRAPGASLEAGQASASADAGLGPPVDVFHAPSQLLTLEVLRRPIEFTLVPSWAPGIYLIAQGRVASPTMLVVRTADHRAELAKRLKNAAPPDVIIVDSYYWHWWKPPPDDPLMRYVADQGLAPTGGVDANFEVLAKR